MKVGATLGGTEVPPYRSITQKPPYRDVRGAENLGDGGFTANVSLQQNFRLLWGGLSTWVGGPHLFHTQSKWGGHPHSLPRRQSIRWGPCPASRSPFVPTSRAVTQTLAAPSCHLLEGTRGS